MGDSITKKTNKQQEKTSKQEKNPSVPQKLLCTLREEQGLVIHNGS